MGITYTYNTCMHESIVTYSGVLDPPKRLLITRAIRIVHSLRLLVSRGTVISDISIVYMYSTAVLPIVFIIVYSLSKYYLIMYMEIYMCIYIHVCIYTCIYVGNVYVVHCIIDRFVLFFLIML